MGGFVSAGLGVAQLIGQQQQANAAARTQAEQVAAQNRYQVQQQQIRAKQQRDLLASQLAATRARLAAGGVGFGAGSGQALLSGMVKDSESRLADSEALLRTRQINSGIGLSSRDGLLQGLATVQKAWGLLRGLDD